MDMEIAQSIEENLVPWPGAWNEPEPGEYLHVDVYQKILPQYMDSVTRFAVRNMPPYHSSSLTLLSKKSTVPNWKPPKPFIYTPLHGVGGLVFPSVCRSAGIEEFTSVPEQAEPNPDFPTVSFPNPEETGALDLAMRTADKEGKSLIIANDPDADRFAVAEKVEYVVYSCMLYTNC